jgi:hypothetical protein
VLGVMLGVGAKEAKAQIFVGTPRFAFGLGAGPVGYPAWGYPAYPAYPVYAPPVVAPYPAPGFGVAYVGPRRFYGPRPFYGYPRYGYYRRW